MALDTKTLVMAGSCVGAVVAIASGLWGGLVWATPYLETKPPFAARADVDAKLSQMAMTQNQQAQLLKQLNQGQLFLAQQNWTERLTAAQITLAKRPNDMDAMRQKITAEHALQGIERMLSGQTP